MTLDCYLYSPGTLELTAILPHKRVYIQVQFIANTQQCIQDMSRSNSNSLLLLQHNFSYCKSLYLPDTYCCEAIRTVTNNEQQRKIEAKTNKMKQWQQQRKTEHSIFWNWNISSAHLQKDVNPLKSTLIYILSAFLLSKHVKRYERLSNSKTRF